MTSAYYRNWSDARDKALEAIHRRCQQEISDLARRSFLNIVHATLSYMRHVDDDNRFTARGRAYMDQARYFVDTELEQLTYSMLTPITHMRMRVLRLAHASELEVLARLKSTTLSGKPPELTVSRTMPASQARIRAALQARIRAALHRLGDKLKQEIERGYVNSKTADEIVVAVKSRFPKPVRYKRPPRELKPFREVEASGFDYEKPKAQASLSFVTDDEWDDIIDSYKKDYVPLYRGPEYVFDKDIGAPELEEWYGWEIEQEVAQDFVERVRDGQVQAANDAGIDDMIWIAILDDKTRPEHRAKHGLTSREIEAKLENEWADFEDQTIVPPGGFNCRCRPAPYDSSLPEAPEFIYEDFDTWLNT